MLIKDFEKVLAADESLAKKFEALKKEKVKGAQNDQEAFLALAEAARELGYEIEDADSALEAIMSKEVDAEELDKVSGGYYYYDHDKDWCMFDYSCHVAFLHPSERLRDAACWSDFLCMVSYHENDWEDDINAWPEGYW